jgi:hypothetical protein
MIGADENLVLAGYRRSLRQLVSSFVSPAAFSSELSSDDFGSAHCFVFTSPEPYEHQCDK